jgi:hypothetical protein
MVMLARIAAWYVCVHWLAAQLSKNDLRAVEAWGLAPRGWLYWLLSSRPSAAEAFGRGAHLTGTPRSCQELFADDFCWQFSPRWASAGRTRRPAERRSILLRVRVAVKGYLAASRATGRGPRGRRPRRWADNRPARAVCQVGNIDRRSAAGGSLAAKGVINTDHSGGGGDLVSGDHA